LSILVVASKLFAWGADGHEITALIAVQHLSDKARQLVFDLLKNDPDTKKFLKKKKASDLTALGAAMAQAATWPDRVKKGPVGKGTGNWHFVDIAADEGDAAIDLRCGADGDCITAKLRVFRDNIPARKTFSTNFNTYTPAEELKFVIHFAGDIHQPLHCATDADAGGNCIKTKGFGQPELHAVWDDGLVAPLHGKGSKKKTNPAVAKDLDSEFAARFDEWSALTDERKIALESHDTAFRVAYAPILPKLPAPEPRAFKLVIPFACNEAPDFKNLPAIDVSMLYDDDTKKTVREQLARGGFRLAAMLNSMAP
jgi:hypothetical protein